LTFYALLLWIIVEDQYYRNPTSVDEATNLMNSSTELAACLPVMFSASSELQYAIGDTGDLLSVNLLLNTVETIAKGFCPFAVYMGISPSHMSSILEARSRFLDWAEYDPDKGVSCTGMKVDGLEGGEIVNCRIWGAGLLLAIVTYRDQRPTELIQFQSRNFERILSLQYTYKPHGGGLAILNGGEMAAVEYGDKGQDVILIDLKSHKILKIFRGHEYWVDACAFVSKELLVTGGQDRTLRFWDISSQRILQTIEGVGQVHQIEWAENHQALVALTSSSSSKTRNIMGHDVPIPESCLRLWRLNGRPPKVTVCGSWDEHYAQAFTLAPDQETIITGQYPRGAEYDPGCLRLWKMRDLLPT